MTRLVQFIRSRAGLSIIGVAAIVTVLYGIFALTVHAPPPSLARLTLADAPKPAPDVRFMDGTGRLHALSEFRRRVVLINLWATWCAPCVRELPALARLSAAMPTDRLTVIAVDVGQNDDPGKARAFLAANDASRLRVYFDSHIEMLRRFHAYGLPTSMLIDADGREIARAIGPEEWDDPEAVVYLKRLADRAAGAR